MNESNANEIIFLMGTPAAGKSTFGKKRFGSTHSFIDCDLIKATHPEYDPNAPQLVHEWSAKIAREQFFSAIESATGKWVMDGTGSNAEKMVHDIKIAKEAGFTTKLVYVKCSLETSLRRAARRERKVPEFIIREKAEVISTSFEIVSKYVDSIEVFDNDTDR